MARHDGDVYYNQEHEQFFQVRGIHDDYLICGGFSTFYDDCQTTLREQNLSYRLVSDSILVSAIDECEYAEATNVGGLVSWRVKDKVKVYLKPGQIWCWN